MPTLKTLHTSPQRTLIIAAALYTHIFEHQEAAHTQHHASYLAQGTLNERCKAIATDRALVYFLLSYLCAKNILLCSYMVMARVFHTVRDCKIVHT